MHVHLVSWWLTPTQAKVVILPCGHVKAGKLWIVQIIVHTPLVLTTPNADKLAPLYLYPGLPGKLHDDFRASTLWRVRTSQIMATSGHHTVFHMSQMKFIRITPADKVSPLPVYPHTWWAYDVGHHILNINPWCDGGEIWSRLWWSPCCAKSLYLQQHSVWTPLPCHHMGVCTKMLCQALIADSSCWQILCKQRYLNEHTTEPLSIMCSCMHILDCIRLQLFCAHHRRHSQGQAVAWLEKCRPCKSHRYVVKTWRPCI